MDRSPRALVFFALLGLVAPACGTKIGDACTTNVDCAQDGTRDCDLSQPGGYCTINGCDEISCPSEASCIRVFPYEFPAPGCTQDSSCTADQICLPEGICAPRLSERRYCELRCSSNGDCRGGYLCLEAGIVGRASTTSTHGSIALVANVTPSTVIKVCVPAL